MTDWPRQPQHPREPSPLDVLEAVIFNPLRFALSASIWAVGAAARVGIRARRAWEERG